MAKRIRKFLVKHGGYYIRVHPCSLQLISNNVCIPHTFKLDKNPDSNKNIDEQLVEKNCSIISDDEGEFYSRVKSVTLKVHLQMKMMIKIL